MKIFFVMVVAAFSAANALAAADFLAQATVKMESTRSAEVIGRVAADPKAVFQRYQPALDGSSKIVRPVQVTGPADRPVMQVSIQKCVAFICETVDLDALISLQEVRSSCDRSYRLTADLSRSSPRVRDVYDRLDVQICYKASPDGRGTLQLSAAANQAPSYSEGFVQNEMLKLLRLQVTPIVKAVELTIKAKE